MALSPAQQQQQFKQRQQALKQQQAQQVAAAKAKAAPVKGAVRPGPVKGVTRPTSPATAGAAPGATATPLAMPPDAAYEAAQNAYQQSYNNTISGLQSGRVAQLAAYGMNEDPTSRALSFDPNNPFSKAALLKQSYDQSRARTRQTIGSTGGLYSGAAQNAQDYINRAQLQSEDALQKSLASWLAQNTIDVQTAGDTLNENLQGAWSDRMDRLAAGKNPLYEAAKTAPAKAKGKSTPVKPKGPHIGSAIGPITVKPKPRTLTAKPGGKGVTVRTRNTPRGRVKTYTRSVNRP